jgi:hypothetical protein
MHTKHFYLNFIQKRVEGDRTKGDANDPNAIGGQQNLIGG